MRIQAPCLHYRICNADYAVLTASEEICRKANEAADRLAALGLHLGTVRLESECPETQLRSIANLLHPLQICAVVDPEQPAWLARLTEEALAVASRDGSSPWRGRLPRVLSFQPAAAVSASDLVSLTQGLANHTIADDVGTLRLLGLAERKRLPRSSSRRLAATAASAVA